MNDGVSVGNQRPNEHEVEHMMTSATGKDTGTSEEWQLVKKKKRRSIQGTKITWATDTKVKSEDSRSPKELKNKRCVSRAFSRNNPV